MRATWRGRLLPQSERARFVGVFLVGHPDGDGLQFSLPDSELPDLDDSGKLVRCRTAMVGGGSGSPIFDLDWQMFAIDQEATDVRARTRTYAILADKRNSGGRGPPHSAFGPINSGTRG